MHGTGVLFLLQQSDGAMAWIWSYGAGLKISAGTGSGQFSELFRDYNLLMKDGMTIWGAGQGGSGFASSIFVELSATFPG